MTICMQFIGRLCLCVVSLSLVRIFYKVHQGNAITPFQFKIHSHISHMKSKASRETRARLQLKASKKLQRYDEQSMHKLFEKA